MIIAHCVSSLDTKASGPSYSVPRLASALSVCGCNPLVLTLGVPGDSFLEGVMISRFTRDWARVDLLRRLGFSSALRKALEHTAAEIFHVHGLWMMPNVYPSEVARSLERPLVLSPRGMLGKEALEFSRTAKHVFWALRQKRAIEAVNCFHATAQSEYDDIRAFGLKQPVAIIPNGIDLPDLRSIRALKFSNNTVQSKRPFVLSLGRVHPKKGLDRLIVAFSKIACEFPDWDLRIVGPEERGHVADLNRLIVSMNLSKQISIGPPLFGDEKIRIMSEAELFALPTLHENFGITVAESLAVETPVISTKGAPWRGLEEQGCGWWVDHGPEAMANALRLGMSMSILERKTMGIRGREWMARDFAWNGVAAKMKQTYSWLLGRNERPDFVFD